MGGVNRFQEGVGCLFVCPPLPHSKDSAAQHSRKAKQEGLRLALFRLAT